MSTREYSEKIAKVVLEELLPVGNTLISIEDQSHGEHDFDIEDKGGNKIGIVEVTMATHELSMKVLAQHREHGTIKCENFEYSWVLLAHNLDPRWMEKTGCKNLSTLVRNGITKFSENDKYSPVREVAEAVLSLTKNGINNGEQTSDTAGTIGLLMSSGEDDEPNIVSPEGVVKILLQLLKKPDNSRKLSKEIFPCQYTRHLFVLFHNITQSGEIETVVQASPPSVPPNLKSRATHVWAVSRFKR